MHDALLLGAQAHLSRVGEERCAYVRAMVFANKAMATRTALAQQAENWLRECGTIPPGNGEEQQLWEVGLQWPFCEQVYA